MREKNRLRVALAQINPRLADVEENLKKHLSFIEKAIEVDASSSDPYLNLSTMYYKNKRISDAKKILLDAKKNSKDNMDKIEMYLQQIETLK